MLKMIMVVFSLVLIFGSCSFAEEIKYTDGDKIAAAILVLANVGSNGPSSDRSIALSYNKMLMLVKSVGTKEK